MTEKRVNVLLVEDNPLHVKLVPRLIKDEAQFACDVTEAGSVAEALEELERGIDLVLSYLVLPDCQDLETLFNVTAAAHNTLARLQANSASWDCQ